MAALIPSDPCRHPPCCHETFPVPSDVQSSISRQDTNPRYPSSQPSFRFQSGLMIVGPRLRLTDGGEVTHSYSVESGGEVKMTKQEIIEMIHRAGFDPVERDTVYNRVDKVAA